MELQYGHQTQLNQTNVNVHPMGQMPTLPPFPQTTNINPTNVTNPTQQAPAPSPPQDPVEEFVKNFASETPTAPEGNVAKRQRTDPMGTEPMVVTHGPIGGVGHIGGQVQGVGVGVMDINYNHQMFSHDPPGEYTGAVQVPASLQVFGTNQVSSTEHVAEARRKMNQLLQTQSRAQEDLKAAQTNLEQGKQRVDFAKSQLEQTDMDVHQGTEDLTDALLQEPTHWNAMYRKMVEYKEKHGHVDVKRNPLKSEKEANPDIVKLGSWVGRVRLEARRPVGHPDHIEPYKVIALNRLGFNWEPRENYWMEKYEELKNYMTQSGKNKMPTRKEPLGVWCDGQVLEYNKFNSGIKPCYITRDRIDMLNNIGFIWDRMGTAWKELYNELKGYSEKYGHCHVPANYGDKTLFRWIAKQRKKFKNYKAGKKPTLTEEQVTKLEEIGFFEPSETRLAKYNAQKEHQERFTKRERKAKARGRPKSKSLIPQEAQAAMEGTQPPPTLPAMGMQFMYPFPGMPIPPTTFVTPAPPVQTPEDQAGMKQNDNTPENRKDNPADISKPEEKVGAKDNADCVEL